MKNMRQSHSDSSAETGQERNSFDSAAPMMAFSEEEHCFHWMGGLTFLNSFGLFDRQNNDHYSTSTANLGQKIWTRAEHATTVFIGWRKATENRRPPWATTKHERRKQLRESLYRVGSVGGKPAAKIAETLNVAVFTVQR